jgi:hypothetical protein
MLLNLRVIPRHTFLTVLNDPLNPLAIPLEFGATECPVKRETKDGQEKKEEAPRDRPLRAARVEQHLHR